MYKRQSEEDPAILATEMELKIESGSCPIELLAKSEILSQNPEAYRKKIEAGGKPRRASAEVALLLGDRIRMGDRVAYYIGPTEKGQTANWHRAQPAEWFGKEGSAYDSAYYLKKLEDWRKRYSHFHAKLGEDGAQKLTLTQTISGVAIAILSPVLGSITDIKGNPTAYISHKAGRTAKDYQQYGGLSPLAGEFIYNHPLTQKFLKIVALLSFTDFAFSIDSITTAVAISDQYILIIFGAIIGVLALRFTSGIFLRLLEKFLRLETAGYIAILIVGIKLLLNTLITEAILPDYYFYVLILISFVWGLSKRDQIT